VDLVVQDLIFDRSLANALNYYSGYDGIVDYVASKKNALVRLQFDAGVASFVSIGQTRQERRFIEDQFRDIDSWTALSFVRSRQASSADVNLFSVRRFPSQFAPVSDRRFAPHASLLPDMEAPVSAGGSRIARPRPYLGDLSLTGLISPGSRLYDIGCQEDRKGLLGVLLATASGFMVFWRRDRRQKLTRNEKATIVHEVGHSIGLNHPAGDPWNPALTTRDTVMSYNRTGGASDYTFSSLDISAMQALWGADVLITAPPPGSV